MNYSKRTGNRTQYPSSRSRKRKIRWGRLILLVVILAAIITGVILLINLIFGDKGSPNTNDPQGTGVLSESARPGESGSAAEATPTPEPTPTALPEDLTITGEFDASEELGIETDIMANGSEVDSYTRETPINFGQGDNYTEIPGILTLGGNNYRNTFSYGTANITEKKLERIWEVPMGAMGSWTGSGWTGQPMLVQWPEETRKVLGINDAAKAKEGLVEVIYPTMDGNIYFIDLETGDLTRDKLNIGVSTKGTGSIDPRGYPILYTGQGLDDGPDGKIPVYFRAIDLIKNEAIELFGGKDPFSHRSWQAYDSSAIIDAGSDTLVTGGENGVIYTMKLNSEFDAAAGTVSINPGENPLVKYRYTADGYGESNQDKWWGIENSISTFRNYAFFTDNGGMLQCIDLNTMELVYAIDVTDDSDTSLVIEEDIPNNTFYLYTANEVDKQEGASSSGRGDSYHRKIDGRTGDVLWEKKWESSIGNSSSNGGTLTTPALGKGNVSDLIIYSMDLTYIENSEGNQVEGGRIVAYNRKDGTIAWEKETAADYWASPVLVYDENENGYLLQADRRGILTMYDATDGTELDTVDLGSRVDSTPAVFGDMLVVGTRGVSGNEEPQKIIGVRIS